MKFPISPELGKRLSDLAEAKALYDDVVSSLVESLADRMSMLKKEEDSIWEAIISENELDVETHDWVIKRISDGEFEVTSCKRED